MQRWMLAFLFAMLLLAGPAEAQISLLHEFAGGAADGSSPHDSLVFDGTFLYGMTRNGGDSGLGTIFKIGTDGSGYALLHEFAGGASDGSQPEGSLCLSGTTLYGMTQFGGANGKGTIFKIESNGTAFTILHGFAGFPSAASPRGSLVVSDSTLYGSSDAGGSANMGALFKISTSGTDFVLLHSFTGGSGDGYSPTKSLALAGTTLYGMTRYGGDSNVGTIFKIETNGTGYSLLREFSGGGADGSTPYGGLLYVDSLLYGMTRLGGDANFGTIFRIQANGSDFNLLHEFAGGATGGKYPEGSLIVMANGLYGMTSQGGDEDNGVLFVIDRSNPILTLLHEFAGGAGDADTPYGSPTRVAYTVFGLSRYGGDGNWGVLFSSPIPIVPTLYVDSPDGGESWLSGTSQNIQWSTFGSVGNVDLIYTYDNGSTWHSVIADTANDGSHLWTVPDTPSSNCYVQVLEHADGYPNDRSDLPFTIVSATAPQLQLTSPNGWEHWTLGSTQSITWNAVNYAGTVRLVLFKGGSRFGNIATGIPATMGSYICYAGQTVDSGMAPEGYDYRLYLRSTDGTLIDPSDYRLALIDPAQLEVTSPNGGESWELGTTRNITWNANGYAGTVRLVLFKKGNKIGQIVASLPADQGSYAWTVGTHQAGIAPAGGLYSIRVLAADGSQDDFSDGPLTLFENDALIVDHQHTHLNTIPSQWLEQVRQHKLLVLSARGNDAMSLGLRLLGKRDSRLAPAVSASELGLALSEGSWLPQGANLELQQWQWALEKAVLESQATVVVIRPDEQALLAGRLNAESYLSVLTELAIRLPDVKLVSSTVSMDEANEVLAKFNRQVRESVLMNRGMLLDTADIESWHHEQQHLANEVPVRHPAYCAASGAPASENLANQGTAAWWLLARLSGWEGKSPGNE